MTRPGTATPHVAIPRLRPRTRAVVLLLHGGAETGTDPVSRWAGPPLRMLPFGWAIRRRRPDIAVARLRYRHRGWNDSADPVADVLHALDRIAARRQDLPFVLVGHSMGARAAIHGAGDPRVRGVVALAAWVPRDDPVEQLAGKDLVLIHGADDRRTSPAGSARFARRADGVARSVRSVEIPGGDHAMLRHAHRWHRLTADAVGSIVDRD